MLLDFTVSNFRCFESEAQLSFVRPSLKTQIPKSPWTWTDVTFRVAAVLGANASGKSTLLNAVSALSAATAQPGSLLHHPHATAAADAPTAYDVNFVADEVRYRYEVEAAAWGIRLESLHAFPKGSARHLYTRTQATAEAPIEIKVGSSLKGPTAEVKRLLTPADLMLAVAARYRHTTLQPIARGIRGGTTIAAVRRNEDDQDLWLQWVISRMVEDPPRWTAVVRDLARTADLGITAVEVREKEIPPELLQRIRAMLAAGAGDDELREIPEDAVPSIQRSLVFSHANGGRTPFELGLGAQSTGTITWLATAAPAIETLGRGGLLVVDELDASLHPSLTAALVTMFKDQDLNRTGAQILFSTHDATLLGNSPTRLLEPGEVWFCEKDDASSEVFPLSDFDSRPGNNEQKRYLAGRFGALPDVDLSRLLSHDVLGADSSREA
ncbi:ATP/GTP-binding protein [Actinomyces gerencseriae]|uniref:AAA family ATPase n=1 Tax=Actinomyces gerencseriae TaxID=52769 RepID=UPI0023F15AEE|nr:ATP-binding protein [Actinomyces gerencseriae]